jgi:hypothetical protein
MFITHASVVAQCRRYVRSSASRMSGVERRRALATSLSLLAARMASARDETSHSLVGNGSSGATPIDHASAALAS